MKVLFSLLLGGLILYWMYRDFDFTNVGRVLVHEMDWTWMLLSFPYGVLAQMLRGWRWQMSLEPIGEHARASVSVNSIFLSYAVSLVVPRVGEFARCGVLKRYDGVSFTKALGTVVTERSIDSLRLLAITLVTLFFQLRVFDSFFSRTGTNIETLFSRFSTAGYIVTAVCVVAAVVLLWVLLRRFSIYNKVKHQGHPRSFTGFRWMAQYKKYSENIHTGRYTIRPGENVYHVFSRLYRGYQEPMNLTVGSVRTLDRLARSISKQLMIDSAELA